MRIALIGCMVMNREISYLISKSKNIVRVWWLRQGLHDTPDILHEKLQEYINDIEQENEHIEKSLRFEAIVLAYGLCSNAVIGLESRTLPIVIPRCDDCISLFLGSSDRYNKLFKEMPGTYWFNPGWIEQAFTPSKENYARKRAEYVQLYGEENADYLMKCTNNWIDKYKNCAYISCPLDDKKEYEEYAQKAAADFGWKMTKIEGSMSYLEAIVNGPWDRQRFLICQPKSCVTEDFSRINVHSMPV